MTKHAAFVLAAFLSLPVSLEATAAEAKPFPGAPTKWQGFARHDFKVGDLDAIVVVPEKSLPGRPWVWRGEFFGAFADADVALVKAGWHLAYVKVPDLFGSPKAIKQWELFHEAMVKEYGLHAKPGFIGLSRGGLYCVNWAAAHPDKTLAVYLDNAVCDFKSWPGGMPKKLGSGKGSDGEWKKMLVAFDFKSDEDAISYKLNPVDNLAPLAKAKIPLLLVYGDKDTVVPHTENSELVFDRYKALGGPVERVVKPGQDHHPHGLKDVTPVVTFFANALEPKKAEPERLKLWNMNAPQGDGTFEKADAVITVHRPEKGKANGTTVVICPGGGYGGLVTGAEGHGIAAWLNTHGVTGVVLEYRLPKGRPFVPLLDAQRAIRTVRANAKAWDVDPAKVGIIGFSAGGHLASTAGTHFDDGNPKAEDVVEQQSCRPDFMILVYPVVSMGEKGHGGSRNNLLGKAPDEKLLKLFSNELQVTAKTPPAFLAHAKDDKVVVLENSKAFYDALQTAKVPSKYLELPSGGHGLNGYKGPMWDAWQTQSLAWLGELKFIPVSEKK